MRLFILRFLETPNERKVIKCWIQESSGLGPTSLLSFQRSHVNKVPINCFELLIPCLPTKRARASKPDLPGTAIRSDQLISTWESTAISEGVAARTPSQPDFPFGEG